jgi:hypothetical protein
MFDVIMDVCTEKTGTLPKDIHWGDVKPSAFMMQRWVSMSNISNALSSALMVNQVVGVLDDVMTYRLLTTVTTPASYRFRYVKKTKVAKVEKKEVDTNCENEVTGNDRMYGDDFIKAMKSRISD